MNRKQLSPHSLGIATLLLCALLIVGCSPAVPATEVTVQVGV